MYPFMVKLNLPSCKQRPLAFPIYISVLYSSGPHISSYNALTMIFMSFFFLHTTEWRFWERLQGPHRKDTNRGAGPQRTYIYRVQSSVWRLPNYWPPTPSPPSECVLPPVPKPVGYTLTGRWGGGGSIFQKTPDIGLASYSIIPLRFLSVLIIVYYCCECTPFLYALRGQIHFTWNLCSVTLQKKTNKLTAYYYSVFGGALGFEKIFHKFEPNYQNMNLLICSH